MKISELQRMIDQAHIDKVESFFVKGQDQSYEFLVRYAEYLVEFLRNKGCTEFSIEAGFIRFLDHNDTSNSKLCANI